MIYGERDRPHPLDEELAAALALGPVAQQRLPLLEPRVAGSDPQCSRQARLRRVSPVSDRCAVTGPVALRSPAATTAVATRPRYPPGLTVRHHAISYREYLIGYHTRNAIPTRSPSGCGRLVSGIGARHSTSVP